jgi:hypothetical protein
VVLGLVDVCVADPTVEHLHHHIFRACAPVVVVTTTYSHMKREVLVYSCRRPAAYRVMQELTATVR